MLNAIVKYKENDNKYRRLYTDTVCIIPTARKAFSGFNVETNARRTVFVCFLPLENGRNRSKLISETASFNTASPVSRLIYIFKETTLYTRRSSNES